MGDVTPTHEVLGVGNPFVDYILPVNESFLDQLPGAKGGMIPVDYQTLLRIIGSSGTTPKAVLGGSCTNAIKGLAHLGHRCALIGKIGDDDAGEIIMRSLEELDIVSYLGVTETPTGQTICLITPDHERTMRAFLGASLELSLEELVPKAFEHAKLVHIEGYTVLNSHIAETAMQLAKEAGAQISLDLGSFEVVNLHKDTFVHLISRYVDILFANREEVFSLTRLPPELGGQALEELCDIVVVLLGDQGSWVAGNGMRIACPAYPVKAIDSTGAGDLFASGFLHGYLKGKPLEKCAQYGALAGAAVVQVPGVELSPETWKKLKVQMK